MNRRFVPLVLLTGGLLVMVLLSPALSGAENEPKPQSPPSAEVEPDQQDSAELDASTPGEQSEIEQAPPVIKSKPVKTFKPSETIGADSAVSFPIDI